MDGRATVESRLGDGSMAGGTGGDESMLGSDENGGLVLVDTSVITSHGCPLDSRTELEAAVVR